MLWRHLLVKSDVVISMLEFSKFFGPVPRKHRLTVYRGFQVSVPRRANFRTVMFSERNTGAVYLGAEAEKLLCIT